MQLRFVGCGDAFGSGGRLNTCFHISGREANFLIDCGASALPALKRLEIDRDEIDLILITHFHGDHFAGLPFLLLDAQFSRRTRPLTIAGPQGIERRLRDVMEALFEHSSKTKQRFELDVVEFAPGQSRTIERRHAMRPITTRRYYPGEHRIAILVNGVETASQSFVIVMPSPDPA